MEKAFGQDHTRAGAFVPLVEKGKWMAHWTIKKFLGDYPDMTPEEIEAAGVKPYEVLEIDGNLLLNDGINAIIWPAVVGSLATPLNGTDGCMGVGDSSTAAAASQTGLQAGTNHLWVLLSATPTVGTSQQLVASATFASAQANWVWNEICIGVTSTPASLPANAATPPATAHVLNRLAQNLGTKASGTTWTGQLTVTLS